MAYMINFAFLAVIYFLLFFKKWKKQSGKEFIIKTLMYVYICMVFYVTIMPFPVPTGSTNNQFLDTANFIPFRDYINNYLGAKREIILNIVMMVPFGFLYPITNNKKLFKTVFVTFFFSLFIESVQLLGSYWASLYARSFDVTDLITNTFGGFVGYFFFVLLKPFIRKIFPERHTVNTSNETSKILINK